VELGEEYQYSFWAKLSDVYKDAPEEQRNVDFAPFYVSGGEATYLGSYSTGVLSGEITIGINYLSHTLKKNTVMQVYPDDIIEHTAYSADFKGYLIIHSAELKKEIMAMTSGIRLQQAGQLKKLHTRQELSEEESLRLRKQVELIKSYIPDKEHVYHSYVIKNQIINLFFDLDNCRWHRYGDGERHQ
jgi:AraC family transcriptional activator of pobA